jgi:hypothetical protein
MCALRFLSTQFLLVIAVEILQIEDLMFRN